MKRGALHYLEPIETPSRGVAVLEAMVEMIERAGLQVGDRLPPEVAIASALGVGRSTIREALNRWDMRRVIESGTVRRAASNATAAQRQEISRLCDELLGVVAAGQPYRTADMAFHAAICDATGNPMFGHLLQRMDEAFERSAESPFSVPGFGLASFPPHRNLSDAIVAGDPDAAEAALHEIIDRVEAEIRVIIADGPPSTR
jgi:DNA-binding FadR family transcriptional regulator